MLKDMADQAQRTQTAHEKTLAEMRERMAIAAEKNAANNGMITVHNNQFARDNS